MLLLFLQAVVAQPPLNLTCVGGGTANKAAVATVNSYGNASGMVGTTPFSASGNGSSTVFIAVVATHGVIHALQVAKLHNYSVGGTVGFVLVAAVAVGWIYLLQWIAMTRLAKGH